ncbi:MAG TPA: GTPase RsgA, partial [Xylella taiwanensis]
RHERAVVGDWVLLDGRCIVALLPRRTVIKRLAAGEHYRQQMIAANLDTAFIVCGLDGDFNPRRIERYCVLIGSGGVAPVVVLTKVDRCADVGAAVAVLREHSLQAVVAVDAREAEPVAALRPWLLPGRTVALVGSSGAGKSTLTNTLLGEQRMRVGAVRQRDSRGRHTTTYRALLALPSGACLIDTPG